LYSDPIYFLIAGLLKYIAGFELISLAIATTPAIRQAAIIKAKKLPPNKETKLYGTIAC
jgi:hypothetical protein